MKYFVLIIVVGFLFSCSKPQADLSKLIDISRMEMEDMVIITGYRPRDKSILKEYDLISESISKGNESDLSKLISDSRFLAENQKTELQQSIGNEINSDALKLALIGFYKRIIIDYNYPTDAVNVIFQQNGIVEIDLFSSTLKRSIEYSTNRRDFEDGKLYTQDIPYGMNECKLRNAQKGDSIFGYFVFPYFNMEKSRVEFTGVFE